MRGDRPEATVVGSGIAGVMTALSLLRKGCRVTLVDRWEPGHARASSSDYTRIIRAIHGSDELYTRWVREARLRWLELQAELGCILYVECGALILAGEGHTGWEDSTFPTFERLGVPHFRFDVDEIRLRFPQFRCANVAYGIFEPESGLLMARRAVVQVANLFAREGGELRRGRVTVDDAERPCLDGRPIASDLVVMTAGPWLGDLFRRTVRPISKVVRQDIVYTSTPEADTAYDAERMPCWVDHGYGAYGTPSVEGCGVKAAIAWEATVIDLDEDARVVEKSAFLRTRQYLRHRFPGPRRATPRRPEGVPDRDDPGHPLHHRLPPRARERADRGGLLRAPLQARPGVRRLRGRGRTSRVGHRPALPPRATDGPLPRRIPLRALTPSRLRTAATT